MAGGQSLQLVFKSCLKFRPLALPCSCFFVFAVTSVPCKQLCWLPQASVERGTDTEGPRAVFCVGIPARGQNAGLSLQA